MPKVIRKPSSKQTRAEKLINLKAARAARKRNKYRRKQKKPRRIIKKPKRRVRRKRKPMAKRRRTNNLTGGTKDVNPQFYTGSIREAAPTTWTNVEFVLPINRLPTFIYFVFNLININKKIPNQGSYGKVHKAITCTDLTDGAGHGILVATDTFQVAIQSQGYVAAQVYGFKILYRMKTVGLVEYIGIVQSQQ